MSKSKQSTYVVFNLYLCSIYVRSLLLFHFESYISDLSDSCSNKPAVYGGVGGQFQ